MLPIPGVVFGPLYSATSRILLGETDVSDETRDKIERARQQVDEFSAVVGNFSPTQPGTWGRFAGRLIDYSFDTQPAAESAEQARTALGFDEAVELPAFLAEALQCHPTDRRIFDNDDKTVDIVELNDQVLLCIENSENPGSDPDVYFRPSTDDLADVHEAIANLYWRDRRAIALDLTRSRLTTTDLDLSDYRYQGQRLQHLDEWRRFRQLGMRRNVLLQGPSGCGKTTFCCHAGRVLSNRTVKIDGVCLSSLSASQWANLMESLRPEMLIIDDIDRVDALSDYSVQRQLQFFEERECNIPFTLFTSNDHRRLPSALRRPGRIDQIIEFDEPSPAIRRQIIAELADRVGVEVPDDQLPRLMELHQDYSPAYVREALRRARVHGWDDSVYIDEDSFRMQRRYGSASDWLSIHGYRRLNGDMEFLVNLLLERLNSEVVYVSELEQLREVTFPDGTRICIEMPGEYRRRPVLFYRPDTDGLDDATDAIARLFWKGRQAVIMDKPKREGTICRTLDIEDRIYHGELLDCLQRWCQFRDQGLRRSVLLQGPPGCGKSTFCQHAARELSTRTLLLTPEFFDKLACSAWRNIIELLQPQMVIVDDVDRVSSMTLESKLQFFEEGYCQVPLVMFTTNDHHKLPRPMRRPGRIDQIIEIEPPPPTVCWQLIRKSADTVGVDVPEDQLPRLTRILREQSTAHLIEALRRARVLGWDADPIDGDTTFEQDVAEPDSVSSFPPPTADGEVPF